MQNKELIMELVKMLAGEKSEQVEKEFSHPLKGKPVIVRARDAGVHFGYLDWFEGRTVELSRARRMWRWWAAKQMTLSAVAEFGLNTDKDLRIQNELPKHLILDACEIIPCTAICVESFEKVEPYNEQ